MTPVLPIETLSAMPYILIGGGFLISVFATVIGGAFFLSIPVMQLLFPGISFGAVIGNLKVGSFFRSAASTIITSQKIAFKDNFKLSILALSGTIVGASLISHLSQTWLFPAVIVAVLLAIGAPKLAPYVSEKTFLAISFVSGLYAGVFGAGIGILLIALLRIKQPKDTDIANVKIQARFIEFIMTITAVITHFMYGNLIIEIWVPWSIGAVCGGIFGGLILLKLGRMPGRFQKAVLYAAFAFALIVTGFKAFS